MPVARKETVLRDKDAALPARAPLPVPDLNDPTVLARLKASIAALDPEDEAESIRWIEAVSMYDNEDLDRE